MSEEATPPGIWSSRAKLLTIIGIVSVPIVLAWVMLFYMPELVPKGTTNEGTLIQPAIYDDRIADIAGGQWTLVYLGRGSCDAACEDSLYVARQIRIGLGKDTSRVQRVVLHLAPPTAGFATLLQAEHADATVMPFDGAVIDSLFGDVGDGPNTLYLMDPNGNVILFYGPDKIGKPMMKDLKHLLRISNIG